MTYKKKLIEVALPLEAINAAAAREKSIRHGHPSTLHLWWARRPLAAARAVIFSQIVDDPSEYLTGEREIEVERQRLFRIIEKLVVWENTTNEQVLGEARAEIRKSWERHADGEPLPAFHDPFGGGGTLPLEAQRLGLESYASDLNPVAVLINKAMIEIPPKFAGRPPVNPDWRRNSKAEQALAQWRGAQGLAADIRHYGKWMRDEAEQRIGHLYPKVSVTADLARERPDLREYIGKSLTVIAWLWVRTVKSPNPAFSHVDVPLASTFVLSSKAGKEAYVQPIVSGDKYEFTVSVGKPPAAAEHGTKLSRGANFKCLLSEAPIKGDYIKAEGCAGRMGARLMAVVAEGKRGRVYLSPSADMEKTATAAEPMWKPETSLPNDPRNFWTPFYGLTTYADLFTPRQLVALTMFSDLVGEARGKIKQAALSAGFMDDDIPLADGGQGALAYAEAVSVYLAFGISRATDFWNSNSTWEPSGGFVSHAFTRQAIPMIWDYSEGNPFSDGTGNWEQTCIDWIVRVLQNFPAIQIGLAQQADAQKQDISNGKIISTDPPYYDNISYADLSDFFYVWLRRSLSAVFPELFGTLTVPKAEELVATPYRHGNKEKAENFFLDGMTEVMHNLALSAHPAFPVTIYYAFKQSETADGDTSNTGWATFLGAVIKAGFQVTGTLPMRTERAVRTIGQGTNALASSIVLVCRQRVTGSGVISRRDFVRELNKALPAALRAMQKGNIAPVDLAQAAIGPGMAVFSRYEKVLETNGSTMSVRSALTEINKCLDEVLAEQEGEFDADTRWALAWFEQNGFNEGAYGVAETLCTAKNTSVRGMVEAGILEAKGGKVRLLKKEELDQHWNPDADSRLTIWEITHHLIRRLEQGESGAAELIQQLGAKAEVARDLSYRLHAICERRKWAQEAIAYNTLVLSWSDVQRLAAERQTAAVPTQGELI